MFNVKSEKVHPTLEALEDSSSEGSGTETSVAGPKPKLGKILEGEEVVNKANKSIWMDLLEDFEVRTEDKLGKCKLYMLEGVPLKKTNGPTFGLHMITEEIMQSYGLEFLNSIMDVVMDTVVDRKIPMERLLNQIKSLDFQKYSGNKLFIWIDDIPQDTDPNLSFCRLLITELLTCGIEPELLIPCNDMDEAVLLAILKNMTPSESEVSQLNFQGEEFQAIFKIGLSLALASQNCDLVLIDADRNFYDSPANHNFMTFAEELGHQVLYLKNTPKISNKNVAIQNTVEKIMAWKKKRSAAWKAQLQAKTESSIPSTSKVSMKTNFETAKPSAEELALTESLKNGEIIHKLTRHHFVKPKDNLDNYSSTDSD